MTPTAALGFLALSSAPASAPEGDLEPRLAPSAVLVAPAVPATRTAELEGAGRDRPNLVVPVLHGLALMTVMRGVETYLWPDPFAKTEHFGAHYEEAFSRPPVFDVRRPVMRWDGDSLFINVVGHGLLGSELYLRSRQCRLGWAGSLVFAAGASAVWEYAFEGNGVRPSAQDLVFTPLAGLALGEMRFVLHRLADRIASPAGRLTVRALVDPFGELERALGTDC